MFHDKFTSMAQYRTLNTIDDEKNDTENSNNCLIKELQTNNQKIEYNAKAGNKSCKIYPKELFNLLQSQQLKEIRVVRRNLCYVVGLPIEIVQDKDKLKEFEYFGKYGKVVNIIVNKNPNFKSPDKKKSCAVYVTYTCGEEARIAIADINNKILGYRRLRASYGTTKYCSNFLRNIQCNNKHCYYLHERGADKDSFTVYQLNNVKENTNDLTCNALMGTELISEETVSNNLSLFGKALVHVLNYYLSDNISQDKMLPRVVEMVNEMRNNKAIRKDMLTGKTQLMNRYSYNSPQNSHKNKINPINRSGTADWTNDTKIFDSFMSKLASKSQYTTTNLAAKPIMNKLNITGEIVHPCLRKNCQGETTPITNFSWNSKHLTEYAPNVKLSPAPVHSTGVSRLVRNFFITPADSIATCEPPLYRFVDKRNDYIIPITYHKKSQIRSV